MKRSVIYALIIYVNKFQLAENVCSDGGGVCLWLNQAQLRKS
jgi:hypothetical protein